MSDPDPGPETAPDSQPTELPLIREFDDRSSLWLLEDPQLLRGLLQILSWASGGRIGFCWTWCWRRRGNRSSPSGRGWRGWA